MKRKTIKTLNRWSRNAYLWAWNMDKKIDKFLSFVSGFILKPVSEPEKPKGPKIIRTAYPDGRIINYLTTEI